MVAQAEQHRHWDLQLFEPLGVDCARKQAERLRLQALQEGVLRGHGIALHQRGTKEGVQRFDRDGRAWSATGR